jgi:hypothetical protein
MPLVTKDGLKEYFFDTLGSGDQMQLQMLGIISIRTLYVIIEEYLNCDKSIIVECPFFAKFAAPELQAVVERTAGDIVELHCTVSAEVAASRIRERLAGGGRHEAHHAGDKAYGEHSEAEMVERYAALGIGNVIEVNTEQFGDADYAALLTEVKELIGA